MTVHRIPTIPDKFKKGKKRKPIELSLVVERAQQMRDRRFAVQQIGRKRLK